MRRRPVRARPLRRRLAIVAGLVATVAAMTLSVPTTSAQGTPPGDWQPPSAMEGLGIFGEHCAECHGPLGRGNGSLAGELPAPPPSFADPATVRARTPNEAFDIVTNGRLEQRMPPWRDALGEPERWNALFGAWSYYYTPERLARGRAVWAESCAACHDSQAAPGASDGPVVAWPDDPLLDVSQADLFAMVRSAGADHEDVADLPDAAVWSALDYGRGQTFAPLPHEDLVTGGSISGRVRNATGTGGSAEGTEVRLVPFSGPVPGDGVTVTVGASGIYSATDLVAGPGIAYRVLATFDGATSMHEDDVVLPVGQPERSDVDFTVYESATDVPVSVRAGHLIVSPAPEEGVAHVAEMWVVTNPTDRTLVSDGGSATLRFHLPAAARSVQLDDPRMRATASFDGDTLIDRSDVPPGQRQVVISYVLPYAGTELQLSREVDAATDELQVLVVAPDVTIESAQLGDQETADVEGRTVVRAATEDVAPGTVIEAVIRGLPQGAAPPDAVLPLLAEPIDPSLLLVLGLGVAGVGVLAAFAYPSLASYRGSPARRERLAAERAALVRDMAELDDRHAAGDSGEAHYAAKRAELLDRTIAVARAQRAVDESTEGT